MKSCSLVDRECVPCRGGIPPLRGEALGALLEQLGNGWRLVEEHHLEKEFAFPDFRAALAFVNRVAEEAERQNHHPEITFTWGRVVIRIYTHKIGGLTENDFILSARVDKLV
ncbi:MAG: 4a-hydroxytetrahydrobiopterin dehydratase [Phycisphaerales bacterium]|nr:4a-hydroxytetrahydrobiopterin dehydratase [Phycisphaerales bacterium]